MELTPEQSLRLRRTFKQFNRLMILNWRLGLGGFLNGTRRGGAYMVIRHRGRKSGRTYLTPVNYAEIDGDVYCTAGFGRVADWYRNLMAAGEAEIWLPGGRWRVRAEDAGDDPRRMMLLRRVLVASGFAAPAFGVDPQGMDDGDLAALLDTYRLVRLRRVAPADGPGGPGDLVWVWPLLAGGVLLFTLLWRRRR